MTLAKSLSELGLLYIHLVNHSAMGAPPVPADFKLESRTGFDGWFILFGGFNHASAERALFDKRGDLIAFGRLFLAKPDLVAWMREDAPQNTPICRRSTCPAPRATPIARRWLPEPGTPR